MMINILPNVDYSNLMYMNLEDAEAMANHKPVCALCDVGYPIVKTQVYIPIDSIDGKPTNSGYMLASLEFAQKLKAVLDKYAE